MGIKIGVSGAGQFAPSFIPLFQAYPGVDEVVLADIVPERRADFARRFGIARTVASHDELCRTDVDAIAIYTQRWLHADQAIQALRAGKHVYSAVPAAITLDEISALVETVRETGLVYMVGETSYYYPATIFCRNRFQAGEFGHFVYGEAEYIHDMDVGFYDAYRYSGGSDWKRTASFPPMLYPTHSVSMILATTGARMTDVSCFGYVDREQDGVFKADVSLWGNEFSNQTALFRTSDGGMARINELRRVGYHANPEVRMSVFGTRASFETQTDPYSKRVPHGNASVWYQKLGDKTEDVSALLTCGPGATRHAAVGQIAPALQSGFFSDISGAHPVERLPDTFRGLPNGHEGSHQFLVLDFMEAVLEQKMPPNNAWFAARCCVPGIVAHESAKRGGELLKIPDFGDPPVK
ncbi:MAG: Gfo/Idh/MocA family oxidoreductase [Anaerolineales bacterium]|nr:Gfo/Idh/MocA family oxidoreductase [Anaerolineales bacterium]